jgi:hypothetical protein
MAPVRRKKGSRVQDAYTAPRLTCKLKTSAGHNLTAPSRVRLVQGDNFPLFIAPSQATINKK